MSVLVDWKPGIYPGISNDAYHAGPGVSSTVLKTLYQSPAHCYAKHFDPDRRNSEQTPAFLFGSAAHKIMLEPDDFNAEYRVLDEGLTRAQKAGKDIIAAESRDVITFDEHKTMLAMRDALMRDPVGQMAFVNGDAELSGYWEDEETGMLCKYRPDYRRDTMILDYKTTTDCSRDNFSRDIAKFGYHQSAAWYLDGDAAIQGTDHEMFVLIVQEKKPPYLVATYYLDDATLKVGRKKNRYALDIIAQCVETGNWPTPSKGVIGGISVPRWELYANLDEGEIL